MEKWIKTAMGNQHMRIQGLKSTRKKPPYTYLEDKCNTNVALCIIMEPRTTNKGIIQSNLCVRFPIIRNKGNNTSTYCTYFIVMLF